MEYLMREDLATRVAQITNDRILMSTSIWWESMDLAVNFTKLDESGFTVPVNSVNIPVIVRWEWI